MDQLLTECAAHGPVAWQRLHSLRARCAGSHHLRTSDFAQCLQIETGWIVPTKQASMCAGSREDHWQVHALLYVLYMVVFPSLCSS